MHHLTWPCQDFNHKTADSVRNTNSSRIVFVVVGTGLSLQPSGPANNANSQTQGLSLQQTLQDICTAHGARHREKVHTSS